MTGPDAAGTGHRSSGTSRRVAIAAGLGALAGLIVGVLWGWVAYGAFQPGYMAPHVVASVIGLALTGAAIALWQARRGRRIARLAARLQAGTRIDASDPQEAALPGRRAELWVFLLLAVVIWPFLSVAFVGSYGFLVWMWQIAFGPPGPPV